MEPSFTYEENSLVDGQEWQHLLSSLQEWEAHEEDQSHQAMTIQKKTLALAAGVHIVLILLLGLLAGKEGLLGKKIQALTVQLVPKEKVVETSQG